MLFALVSIGQDEAKGQLTCSTFATEFLNSFTSCQQSRLVVGCDLH